MFYIFGLVLHVTMFHPDASFAMDTKCAIKSSCSLSGCHLTEYTDPITVNPASNITLNCTIITGKLARNMTWNQAVQALERVKNSTGLSNLVLEQSNSTESGGKYSCRCTTIKLARALKIVRPFTSSPNDINQDEETEIKCVFSGWPLPQTVYWLKNGKPITNGTEGIHHSLQRKLQGKLQGKLQRKEEVLYSILRFPPGREEQEGDYLCNATNSIPGWSTSDYRTIEMKYECPIPKGPTISAAEISARIFSNVNLTCLIDWHPDYAWDDCPVNWTWQYFSEDLPITGKKYKQHQIQDTGSKCKKEFVLSIFNVTESDEGTYSCLFICNYRNTRKAAVDLKVFVPPPATEVPISTEHRTTSSHSESRRKWLQAALISSAGIVIILAALCVWFVVKGRRTSSSFKPKYCPNEKEFSNQLFISHSSKDFGWVTENLISIIEKHSIAYSIHNRDFELGKSIVENMDDSVYGSRQVLIVLSENYLASNFCREELHMAVQREADANDSSLILVMINKLKKKQLPAALRKKRVVDFDKHKKREDWEEKMLREISDGESISVV